MIPKALEDSPGGTSLNLKLIACLTILAAFIVQQPIARAQTDSPAPSTEVNQIEALIAIANELRADIDRSDFDLQALLDRLNYDDQEVIEFVRDTIEFESYRGVLRGAAGTLMSKSGNSLDQSLLLASLLKDAGYDARIARGALRDDQAMRLVAQMYTHVEPQLEEIDQSELAAITDRLARELNVSTEELVERGEALSAMNVRRVALYTSRTEQESRWLNGVMESIGRALADPNEDELIREARDYFWVEYRSSASGPWVAVHPAASDPQPFTDVTAQQVFLESIPTELQHRFRIEFFVERAIGPRVEREALAEPWERPVANMANVPVTFAAMSLALNAAVLTGEIGIWDTLTVPEHGNDIFVLDFNGEPLGKAFDLNGSVVPMEAATSNYAALFATLSDSVNLAAGALSELGVPTSTAPGQRAVSLRSVQVVYSFITPDGTESRYERTIFNADQVATLAVEEARLETYRALTRQYSFMVASGDIADSYVLDSSLAAVVRAGEVAEALERFQEPGVVPTELSHADGWHGHYPLYQMLNQGTGSYATYRHEPALVVYHSTLPFDAIPINQTVDIVQSRTRALAIESDRRVPSVHSNLEQGVWETLVESVLFDGQLIPGGDAAVASVADTWAAFEAARSAGIEIMTLTTDDVEDARGLPIADTEKSHILSDLESGYVVVLPRFWEGAEPDRPAAWWRVDPITGSTLGRGRGGQGTVSAQDITFRKALMKGVIGALVGFAVMNDLVKKGEVSIIKAFFCGSAANVAANAAMMIPAKAGGPAGWLFAAAFLYICGTGAPGSL